MLRNLSISSVKSFIGQRIHVPVVRYSKEVCLKLTPDEESKILTFINRSDSDLLKEVNINNTRIIKIEKWKKAHGEFESVEQFGKYNGFGTKSFEKTCDAILKAYEDVPVQKSAALPSDVEASEPVPEPVPKTVNHDKGVVQIGNGNKLLQRRVSTPILSRPNCMAINSFVSVHLGLGGIGWTRFVVDKNKRDAGMEGAEITDWGYYRPEIDDMHLVDIIEFYTRVHRMIPQGDVYIMEEQMLRFHGDDNAYLQHAQSVAVLAGLLANRSSSGAIECEDNLYFLCKSMSGKLYGIFISGETSSTQYIVRKIIDPTDEVNKYIVEEILKSMENIAYTFQPIVSDYYRKSQLIERELMGRSLIIGTTFLRLCMLQCTKSLAIVFARSNASTRKKK